MVKVKDTLKRTIKFSEVIIDADNRLEDELGDVIAQISRKLPKGVNMFDLQVTVALSSEDDE